MDRYIEPQPVIIFLCNKGARRLVTKRMQALGTGSNLTSPPSARSRCRPFVSRSIVLGSRPPRRDHRNSGSAAQNSEICDFLRIAFRPVSKMMTMSARLTLTGADDGRRTKGSSGAESAWCALSRLRERSKLRKATIYWAYATPTVPGRLWMALMGISFHRTPNPHATEFPSTPRPWTGWSIDRSMLLHWARPRTTQPNPADDADWPPSDAAGRAVPPY